ncbi:hypothetical protein Sjap_018133 [Stephania japonica]|uniref:Uncharacterized protein n=1 Tax=Stephania japonica TaxID=461633 RepID=A0AAP0I7M1_9MAGN
MSLLAFPTCSLTQLPPLSSQPPPHTHHLPKRHPALSWTSAIARHCRDGALPKAALVFSRMRLAGAEPNRVTFLTLLSACADFPSSLALDFGTSIHGYISKLGFRETDNVMLWTALVGVYSKCGRLPVARKVFDEMPVRNALSWNAMIDGCMRSGDVEAGVQLFDQMPERDKVSWTAMISGFVKRGRFEEALEYFRDMQLSGVEPDYVTMVAVLAACANLGALGLGMWVHCYVQWKGFVENVRVCNSLIDMYSRCGCVVFARQIFGNMNKRSLVSWNSMIVGFAINGYAEEALEDFHRMEMEGFKPDGVSFTGALTACSHAGFVEKGIHLYKTMTRTYKVSPRIEHYGCIVDLLSRAGKLEDAFGVIKSMKMKPNEVVIGAFLAACRTSGDVELAEVLTKYLGEFVADSDSSRVLLSNIYAAAGRWDDVGRIRRGMKNLGVMKKPGFSSIEIDCKVHKFICGDKSHVESDRIYALLNQLSIESSLSKSYDSSPQS